METRPCKKSPLHQQCFLELVGLVCRDRDVGHTEFLERFLGIDLCVLDDARLLTEGNEMLGAAFPKDMALGRWNSPTSPAKARAEATTKGQPETTSSDGLDKTCCAMFSLLAKLAGIALGRAEVDTEMHAAAQVIMAGSCCFDVLAAILNCSEHRL